MSLFYPVIWLITWLDIMFYVGNNILFTFLRQFDIVFSFWCHFDFCAIFCPWHSEILYYPWSVSQFTQLCLILCDPMDCSTPGFPVFHQVLEFAQTHVHWVSDAIQPSHPLSSPSPPAFNLSQHQGLFQWVSSLHQVVKVLEFQLEHQFFQRIFRADFL